MSNEAIKTMNELINVDLDAIRAYEEAIEACEIFEIRGKLAEFMGEHQRHVRDLQIKVRALGGEPPARRDLKGFVMEGFTALLSQGDRSALLAMRGNEELTNRYYRSALEDGLPDDIRALVERDYDDEVRHLAWIKDALASRAWDVDKAA